MVLGTLFLVANLVALTVVKRGWSESVADVEHMKDVFAVYGAASSLVLAVVFVAASLMMGSGLMRAIVGAVIVFFVWLLGQALQIVVWEDISDRFLGNVWISIWPGFLFFIVGLVFLLVVQMVPEEPS